MPSTYTQNLGIEKPATGEQAGGWGVTANFSYDTIDQATNGRLVAPMSSSTYVLATYQGSAPANGVNRLVQFTGAQTAPGTVSITPNTAQKIYYMQNKTTGGFPLVFKQDSGATFSLQPGYSAVIGTDGAGTGASVYAALDNPQFANALITGNLTVNGVVTWTAAQTFAQPVTFSGAVNLNGPTTAVNLIVNTTGSTPHTNDVYYRAASGALTPLALGSVGQFLGVVSGPALAWTLPAALAIGSVIGSSIAYGIYFSNAGNVLAQDSTILAVPSVGIGIGVLPTHSLHLGYARAPSIWLDTNVPATQQRQIVWATNNAPRWNFYSPQAAEPGGDQASDLALVAYNDPANAFRNVFYMTRTSGNVTIGPPGGDQGARLAVLGDNPGWAVVVVRGVAGQTAALQYWENPAGTPLAWIDGAGVLSAQGASIAGNVAIGGTLTVTNLAFAGDINTPSGTVGAAQFVTTGGYSLGAISNPSHQIHGLSGQIAFFKPDSTIGQLTFQGGIIVGVL